MKPKFIILMLLALVALAAIPVQAQTITMAAPGSTVAMDVMVYYPNGTLQGVWNTSSTIIVDANSSYIFSIKPGSSDPFSNLSDWVTNTAFPWIRSNLVVLLVIAILVGYATSRRR